MSSACAARLANARAWHRSGATPPCPTAAKLEVHLLDFHGDLYGQRLHIRFLHKLRDEIKFADLGSLQTQIAADILAARQWHAARAQSQQQ